MAYIKTLKDNELVGGTDNKDVYPVSTTQALYSQEADGTVRMSKDNPLEPEKLEERLEDHEEDAKELHRKTEKLVLNVSNNGTTLVEITGSTNSIHITGGAKIETYGDEPDEPISLLDGDLSKLTLSIGSAEIVYITEWEGNTTWDLPNVVGRFNAKFDFTYNGISKYVSTHTDINLRKFVGFASEAPSDVTTLGNPSDPNLFGNTVNCTVTVPTNGTGFKRIYFAVPSGMTISRITQPDALNAPLAFTFVDNINRSIGGVNYAYKLYQSTDLIDSSVSKRLTIS